MSLTPEREAASPIILDAYAARSCPVKTQNRYDPTIAVAPGLSRTGGSGTEPGAADEHLLELFAGGKAFEVEMLARIVARASGVTELRAPGERLVSGAPGTAPIDWRAREQATREAVERGDAIILGPVLPIDVDGHRRGRPDLIVRGVDRADGRPGYLPVEVKRHRMIEQNNAVAARGRFSTLGHPCPTDAVTMPEYTVRAGREADLLQMAHYWRMLDSAGWACDAPAAGVIGTDQLPGIGEPLVTWVDLREKFIRTFSRRATSGWALRSPLERYDHEFGFRVRVAEVASQRTGGPDDPRPMVAPIVIRECDHCLWWSVCEPQLHDDDLSLRISKSPLDVREIGALRALGVQTLTDLAGADVDALLEAYLPEVRHRDGAERRLRLAAKRATLMLAGVELERLTDEPIELPEAELEIDLDIETTADDRVYLWGFLVDDRRTPEAGPRFVEFSSFTDLDPDAENDLARRALLWLDAQLASASTALVYHYSDFEPLHITRLSRRTRDGRVLAAAQRINARSVDMFTLVREHFFGANGLGLKAVARSGPGFDWRDADPGGLNSQRWFKQAVSDADADARESARQRVLDYNEDDVRATHALRAWMRDQDA